MFCDFLSCRINLELRESDGSEEIVAGFKKVVFAFAALKFFSISHLYVLHCDMNEVKSTVTVKCFEASLFFNLLKKNGQRRW